MALTSRLELPNSVSAADDLFGVTLFHGHTSLADMETLERSGDEWLAERPGKRVVLVVIYPSKARMTDDERVRMGRLIKAHEQHRLASATVILADGLVGAAQRGVLTALRFLAPPKHPTQVFGSVPAAIAWLHPYARQVNGASCSLMTLLSEVSSLQAAFEARIAG